MNEKTVIFLKNYLKEEILFIETHLDFCKSEFFESSRRERLISKVNNLNEALVELDLIKLK